MLTYLAGVVDNDKLKYLQKTVFRVSRGNIFTLYVNLKNSDSSDDESRRISNLFNYYNISTIKCWKNRLSLHIIWSKRGSFIWKSESFD